MGWGHDIGKDNDTVDHVADMYADQLLSASRYHGYPVVIRLPVFETSVPDPADSKVTEDAEKYPGHIQPTPGQWTIG